MFYPELQNKISPQNYLTLQEILLMPAGRSREEALNMLKENLKQQLKEQRRMQELVKMKNQLLLELAAGDVKYSCQMRI